MLKKSLLFLLIMLTAASVSLQAVNASSDTEKLRGCRRLYAYSGTAHAYFYGFENQTVYSVAVLPQCFARSISVNGTVCAVCHDEHTLYALYKAGYKYRLASLNMDNGKLADDSLEARIEKVVCSSFAADSKSAYLVVSDVNYSKVVRYGRGNQQQRSYAMPEGAESVFINDNKIYAKSYSNEIFQLTDNRRVKCAELERYKKFYNAGAGWIFSEDGRLISLRNGSVSYENGIFCVRTGSGVYHCRTGRLFAAVGNTSATLNQDFSLSRSIPQAVSSANQGSRSGGQTNRLPSSGYTPLFVRSNIVWVKKAGITVTKLKNTYPQVTAVFDKKGKPVTSGAVKTGYSLTANRRNYPIAVKGDVSGNGTVNSADLRLTMDSLLSTRSFSAAERMAADNNENGSVTISDVALLAQMYGS